jgi:hypothetical protein
MGLISLTLPNEGETVDAADVNTPFNTIATVINGNIDNANIKSDAAIDGTKIADNSIPATKMKAGAEGWTGLANTPNTVTYNGNRNYDLVFNSVDVTNTLSPGMKIRLQRTVAAPDQCTDLEAGSSQYYSRASASVAGMTFTDDFVVSAWVKLESYKDAIIASRYNGTSGWQFYVTSNGLLQLVGYNGGAANYSQIASYASLPLNKWVHVTAQLDMSSFTATTTTSYIMFDGVDVPATVTRAGTNPTALIQAGDLQIGAGNTTNYFDGKLAQVAVFNAKVTQATMRTYMSQGLSGSETSLISAYSFDNSINDLNTTNANNLTANGSAVATNADSPFANAVSAGLQEYAEINSVTFSTNTTVNVRVPETSMIPTSGGVSNVYYAVGANPYGLPYFSNVLAQVMSHASFSTTSGTDTQIPALSLSVTIPTNAKVKVSVTGGAIYNGTSSEHARLRLFDGSVVSGTGIAEHMNAPGGTYVASPVSAIAYQNASGSKTYNASLARASAGTAALDASGTFRPYMLTVELV